MAQRSDPNYTVEDVLRDKRKIGQRATQLDYRARLVAALEAQRKELMDAGVSGRVMPQIADNMSTKDLIAAQERMNRMGKSAAKAPAATPAAAATVPAATKNDARAVAAALPGAMAAMGPIAGLGMAAAQAGAGRQTLGNPTGAPAAAVTTAGNGTTSVVAPTVGKADGSMMDAMNARTGGKWGSMRAEQRAQWLRANGNPFASSPGTVVGTGTSPFNMRGERAIETTAGAGVEVDPSRDFRLTTLHSDGTMTTPASSDRRIPVAGAPLLPAGAARGVVIDPKYVGQGDSNVGYITPGVVRDTAYDPARAARTTPGLPAGYTPTRAPAAVAPAAQVAAATSPQTRPPTSAGVTQRMPQTPPRTVVPPPARGTERKAPQTVAGGAALLGSAGSAADILDSFSTNEQQAQFEKKVRFNGFSRGVA